MPSAWFERVQKKYTADAAYRETSKEKAAFDAIRRAEYQYGVRLRKLAAHVGHLVNAFPAGDAQAAETIQKLLRAYAEGLTPWAEATAASMLADVSRRDEVQWAKMTKNMSVALRREIMTAPTGLILAKLQAEQVHYIKKIPLDAAERVHKLTMEALVQSTRASAIAKEIRRQQQVSENYATMLARTEVGRVTTNLTQGRATYVGSEGYIWRTAEDSDVRPSHRAMEGKFVRWDKPPTLDKLTGHAGALPNCRCYPEVVIPDMYN